MRTFAPDPRLSPYIKSFVLVESHDISVNRLLPDTSLVAAIRFNGMVQFREKTGHTALPVLSLSGLRKSFRLVEYGQKSSNLLVLFREGGTTAFFDLPLHEVFESNIALDIFCSTSELITLQEQVETSQSAEQKVGIVQQFFIAKLRHQNTDQLILHSVGKIKAAKGIVNIKDLSDSLFISLDAFEKRFRKNVGATPKQFADIVRMKSVINQIGQTGILLGPALNAGFFDQSHFIRDFKKFTGLTPTGFFDTSFKTR